MMAMMRPGCWLADRLTPRWGLHITRRRVAVAGRALSAAPSHAQVRAGSVFRGMKGWSSFRREG